jgi:hypothetical protein
VKNENNLANNIHKKIPRDDTKLSRILQNQVQCFFLWEGLQYFKT